MIAASGPLVAILGVTGAQGSSVAAALVASALPYRLRGLTRDPSSPAAQKLAAQGIELRSPATAEHALEDASIVFLVCPPTERANEVAWTCKWIDACKVLPTLKLLVYSALDNLSDLSGGRYTSVTNFDNKARAAQHALDTIGSDRLAFVKPCCYAENFATPGPLGLKKRASGGYYINAILEEPKKLPLIAIRDSYGVFVQAAIEKRAQVGLHLPAAAEALNADEIAARIGDAIGHKVDVNRLSYDDYLAAMPPFMGPMRGPLADMMHCAPTPEMHDPHAAGVETFGFYGEQTSKIQDFHPLLARKPLSFADWAKQADWSALL